MISKNNPPSFNVTVTWDFDPTGFKVVELGSGCKKTETYQLPNDLTYFGPIEFLMPNIFTPNGDDLNDKFGPLLLPDHKSYWGKLEIYNRWGQKIFEKEVTGANSGPPFNQNLLTWDGTFEGQPAPVEVYIWTVNFKNCDYPNGIQDNSSDCNCTVQQIANGQCPDCKWKGDVTLIR